MKQIHFGVDYYPEHWERSRWDKDIELMKEMGVQVVRLAEFSWFKMQPDENSFDFEWLIEAVRLLEKNGIKSVLGTPTAAPPAWIIEKHPDILPVDSEGKRYSFGGRHHDCMSNEAYRNYIKVFVTKFAETFKDEPGVIGWQIDNELGNSHGDLCFCDNCQNSFRTWLKNKYGSIDKLNKAWGTEFWSQGYNDFQQIEGPKITPNGINNPSRSLDWKRFTSDLVLDFAKVQVDIIRKICPNHFITHNYMCFDNKVDYYDLGAELDFVSNDIYPAGNWQIQPQQPYHEMGACADVLRGYKKKNYWMMEQQANLGGNSTMGHALDPGQMSAWSMQNVAHGADCIVFFRWRTCAVGTEQFWHGILPHSGIPGRVFYEAKEMISTFSPYMDDLAGTMPNPEVAIIHSFEQNYAFEIQPNHPDLSYIANIMQYYKVFYDNNIPVDFIQETDDFSNYKLVVAPLQYIMTKDTEAKIKDYVSKGGNIVLTYRSNIKDENNLVKIEAAIPGALSEVLGLEIPEYDCLFGKTAHVKFDKENYEVYKWADIIELKGAKVLAKFSDNFYKGKPAATVNEYGEGKAYYIATEPDEKLMKKLGDVIIEDVSLKSLGDSDDGVEITSRGDYIFAINMTDKKKKYKLNNKAKLLEGNKKFELKPYEVQLLKKK